MDLPLPNRRGPRRHLGPPSMTCLITKVLTSLLSSLKLTLRSWRFRMESSIQWFLRFLTKGFAKKGGPHYLCPISWAMTPFLLVNAWCSRLLELSFNLAPLLHLENSDVLLCGWRMVLEPTREKYSNLTVWQFLTTHAVRALEDNIYSFCSCPEITSHDSKAIIPMPNTGRKTLFHFLPRMRFP